MEFTPVDVAAFAAFLVLVVAVSLYASRKEETSEDYFLAGRSLPWWLIGVSLVASNISSEHFVGMAGDGFRIGLAIACFEWVAAIALVLVALYLLPLFLRCGIYTLPEFLEYRYGPAARSLMAFYLMLAYVVVGMAGVLYAGALTLESVFGMGLTQAVWLIGILAGAYTIYGGLKAVVWSDLIQGVALLAGGAFVLALAMDASGGLGAFLASNADRLHLILPSDDPTLPWTIYLLGIWIPNIAYWGLNQFITQRALAARSLRDGQMGVLFAAFLKLLMPFLIVFPGIAAFDLYADRIGTPDQAFPILMAELLPAGFRGIMFAALFGAVMSSLDSMLNSASTIFTIDLYRKRNPDASPKTLIRIGRTATLVFVIIGCLLAPQLVNMGGVYQYMQWLWNVIWPGVLAAFLIGIALPKAPPKAGTWALIVGPVAYVSLNLAVGMAYLNAAAGAFILSALAMLLATRLEPLSEPRALPDAGVVDMAPHPAAKPVAAVIVALTLAIYAYFW